MVDGKSFFRERSVAKIGSLSPRQIYTPRNLVKRILDLADEEALEFRFPLIPGDFRKNLSGREASRKYHKHGNYVKLDFPITRKEAYRSREIPLQIRTRSLSELIATKEQELFVLGFYWYPVQSRDRRKRVVPFSALLEGARLFAYAEKKAGGIDIEPYGDAVRVGREGAEILCRIPSRTKKKQRYRDKLLHVPFDINEKGLAVASSLKSDFEVSPEDKEYDIRYTWGHDKEESERFVFYPQDIAAYMAIIRRLNKEHKFAPLVFNPLALPSRVEAEFYRKLGNNIIIYDPSLASKHKLRKLHLPEKSILIGRSVSVLGHDETMYWDSERDGKIDDYNWHVK